MQLRFSLSLIVFTIVSHIIIGCSSQSPTPSFFDTGISLGCEGGRGIEDMNPVWSNDGRKIVYCHDWAVKIVSMDDLQNPKEIYSTKASYDDFEMILETGIAFVWSPDDKKIGMTLGVVNEQGYISPIPAYVDIENGTSYLLEGTGTLEAWGRHGVLICLYSKSRCRVADPITQEIVRMINENMYAAQFLGDNEIVFSNNGTTHQYNFDTDSLSSVEFPVFNDNKEAKNILSLEQLFVFSEDGSNVAWVEKSRDDSRDTLMLLNRNTGDLSNISELQGFPSEIWSLPSWSPDNQQLAIGAEGTIWIVSVDNKR